ncbi:hypothetical protein LTR56_005483 [Elasticomyces elasticus]|nr:hypothetical protein LTR56_005483 [Elasticomyces elasticus]KAK3665392.1 hypothetical protein LTR22_003622 [Elasticomyces elasticus]KAK4929963.1 hypothetical protein LTR49_003590 [Elasticomyces elasticus]KAK5769226.1 hypothetical protein LTS12_000577 [Elasticomyces elasticus]
MYPMLEIVGVGFLLLQTVTSVPTTKTPSTCGLVMTEGFDYKKGDPPVLPEVPNPPDTPDQGLVYTGWNIDEFAPTADMIPQSEPNTLAAFITNTIVNGAGVSLKPTGSISIGPDLESFDFISFYFACILPDGTTAVALSQPCTVKVTSPDVEDVTFTIVKTDLVAQDNMQKAVLPATFKGVKSVTITLETVKPLGAVSLPGTAGVMFVDNVEHRNNCLK